MKLNDKGELISISTFEEFDIDDMHYSDNRLFGSYLINTEPTVFNVLHTGDKMDGVPNLILDFSELKEYLEDNGTETNKEYFYEENFS